VAPRPKRKLGGTFTVDGDVYEWSLAREQVYTGDGWKGLAFSVRHVEGQRELLLEFPVETRGRGPQLERAMVRPEDVERGLRQALDQGFNPLSRGKTWVFEIEP
jgi:hypothetical protein